MGGEAEEIRLKLLYLSRSFEFGVVRFVFWVFRGSSPRRAFARSRNSKKAHVGE
jgi:hypothetical protein